MKKLLFTLLLTIFCIETPTAQVVPPQADVLEFLKQFPTAQVLKTINNLQADLKACEETKTKILANADSSNRQLTKENAALKQRLSTAEMTTDIIRVNANKTEILTTGIKKDINKSKFWGFVDKYGLAIIAAGVGYTIGKN
ncbi:hypothetical protein VB796_21055 [Arcicella sp. LKC2W]|uniref:hypothetical protein n=1 Tax=Arcicella sp. LKC2W TaxID=2984198 RepID=UPI002B1F33AB|nr:hypothetical protein [Arcicella sp. LKC2W]MEA5461569.1 hypothetical protein [Arcicella sp. LKC2W]